MTTTTTDTREARLLKRIRDMRDLADSVEAELHIAIAQANDLGLPREHLADRAHLTTTDIDAIIADFTPADLAELDDSEMTWVPYHNGAVYL